MINLKLHHIFLSIIKKQKTGFSLLIATSFFGAFQQCITPWAIRYLVNAMSGIKHSHIAIGNAVIGFITIYVISEIIIRSQGVFIALVLPKFRANIKSYFIDNMLKKNYVYFLETMPGSITQKINDFASSSERIIQIVIYNFFTIILSLLFTAILLYFVEPFYSFLVLSWFAIHVTTTWLRLKKSLPSTQAHNIIHSSICGNLCELITRIVSVKTYLGTDYEKKKLDEDLSKEKLSLRNAQLFFEKAKVIQSFFSLFFILILIVHQVDGFNKGNYSIGDFIFVVFIAFNLTNYVWFSSFQLTIFSRELGTLKDAYDGLTKGEADSYYANSENNQQSPFLNPHLKIKNLRYTFPSGNRVINDLSLEINFGEKVLLHGKSGAGKSTLAKILVGLHSNFEGEILIDGKPLSKFSRNALNRLIMLVEQQSILFNRTVRENICYSNTNYTSELLKQALAVSGCDNFINSLPHGLDTKIGDHGLTLSGGQVQRISIARAVLFNPKILILDEATSGLEKDLEKQIINNLLALKNQTLLVISHSNDLISQLPRKISLPTHTDINLINFYNEGAAICQS